MRTIYKICIFILKYIKTKLFHFNGLTLLSLKSINSRCRWTSEFAIIGKSKMKLGNVECASYTRLAAVAGGSLEIGNHCYFNRACTVISRNNIVIGDICTFGPNVCIYDHDHEFRKEGQTGKFILGSVNIGENCWIGANVIIMRNTTIGKNCVIGAGSIVKGNIPDNSLVTMDKKLTIRPLHE